MRQDDIKQQTMMSVTLQQQPGLLLKSMMESNFSQEIMMSIYDFSFDPLKQSLIISRGTFLDGSTRELTQGVFTAGKNGLYYFATAVDLAPKTDVDQFKEKVALIGYPVTTSSVNVTQLPPDLAIFSIMMKLFRSVGEESDLIGLKEDVIDKILAEENRSSVEPFAFSETYRSWQDKKPIEASSQDYLTTLNAAKDIVSVPNGAPPVFMGLIDDFRANLNDHTRYKSAHALYTTEVYNARQNPFHDFVVDLQQPEMDSETAFYSLAQKLQLTCHVG